MLLRPWIRYFTMIISAWWLRTSSKLCGQEFEEIHTKLDTFKQVYMSPKHKVVIAIKGVQIFQQLASDSLMLSGDRWINMHYNNNNVLSQEDFCSYRLT